MSFVTIFGLCELGERVSNAFEESNGAFDRLKWYLFPVEMWQMLPTVIIAAQQPIKFDVFGKISCCREDFKMVRL